MLDASHTLIIASVPIASAGILYGLAHRAHTAAELERELDTELQDRLCDLASSPDWASRTNKEAWAAINQLGGRKHLLGQARLLLALTIEKGKDRDPAALQMEEKLSRLAVLLSNNWRQWLMPQADAHLCVDLYTDMCALWEDMELDAQWTPLS